MNDLILKKPYISEKGTAQKESGKYVFIVSKNANKSEVKKEIERLYNVKVEKVNILNIPSRQKRFRNIFSKKSRYKKAIVTLKRGQSIDLI